MFSEARWRLTFWFTLAMAAILLVICVSVYLVARQSLLSQVRTDLQTQAEAALQPGGGGGGGGGPGGPQDSNSDEILKALKASGSWYVFMDLNGAVIDSSASLQVTELKLPTAASLENAAVGERAAYRNASTQDGDHLRVYVRSAYYNRPLQGSTQGYLMIGRSIEPELQSLRRLVFILIGGGAFGVALASIGGFWLSGRALKPIKETVDAQRQFVADASHELRTPLSLIRANAEIMKRGSNTPSDTESIDDIISETDRLTYLVSQMLTLARADSSATEFEKSPVDLSSIAEDVTRQMRLLAEPKQIAMNLRTNGSATVSGDEQRLGELLLILLDNSIKYTDSGGTVDVDVTQQDGRVRVSVADTGRGIPSAALPHVFDRFYRADKARSREMGGTGLGLAIAQWIAEMHNGSIEISSESGQGTRVTVVLPASAPSAPPPAPVSEPEPELGV